LPSHSRDWPIHAFPPILLEWQIRGRVHRGLPFFPSLSHVIDQTAAPSFFFFCLSVRTYGGPSLFFSFTGKNPPLFSFLPSNTELKGLACSFPSLKGVRRFFPFPSQREGKAAGATPTRSGRRMGGSFFFFPSSTPENNIQNRFFPRRKATVSLFPPSPFSPFDRV